MADIYLNHKNDKKAYAKCYSEILEQNYSVETCLLLGDAYMNIQEAISYYESALSNDSPASRSLRYDLADLYLKLKQYDDVERIALDALEHREGKGNESLLYDQDVKFHKLTAKAYQGLMMPNKALSSLLKAKEIQSRILMKDGGSLENTTQKGLASDLCFEIAELYVKSLKDSQKAIEFYNEAIQHNSMHVKSMLALSKVYMGQGDTNAAQNQCSALLRLDPNSEDATLMIADIMFRKNSFSSAIFHFRQLLEKNPTNYKALRQLVEMMKRAGKLDEADKFFEMAEKSSLKANLHPGYHFCKGLHYRYTNSPNEALKEFNSCRRDSEWGEESLCNMIEIFLNPDNETIGGDALENLNDESMAPSSDKADSELLAILTADKLIKELPQNPKSIRTQVYECYALMATKQKMEIERALSKFTEMLNLEKDFVPALLGIAVAHMLLKQPPRARNQLKRIAKMEWMQEFENDFEKAWLLLGDIHIQGGKFDLATELLKKVLAQNKSCAKAWEYMGYIMEKEASYKDAAEHYESAWKLERESNPSTGYKLAFNYLKAKRNVEAIEVCHKILKMYPDYPKIRKEIMEKARSMLRL
ncbi:Tetratricopeptide repeat protein 21B [Dinochytrium kinnereticum]|nr:Tetratricopeptide repeat protein 21B [Dinochytrium kinnereticum]